MELFRSIRIKCNEAALAGLVIALVATLAAACASHAPKASPVSHTGKGIVVAINVEKSRVKIDHESIPDYMDAMTMWFEVKDAKLLEGLAPNDRIEFQLTEEDSADVITGIKKITP